MDEPVPAAGEPRWLREPLLFALLVGIQLIPIWAFRYFPSQDGPAHLATARMLLQYGDADWAVVRTFYEINHYPVPTWFVDLLLAGLLTIAPPLVAEKLLLSLYVVTVPLSARYAFRALGEGRAPLAVLVLPLIYSYPLHMGFYSFALSIPVFFAVLGFWLRRRGRWSAGATIALTLLLLLLYFCHIVTLGLTGLTLGLLLLGDGEGQRPGRLRALLDRLAARRADLLVLLVASIPAVVLAAVYLARFAGGSRWTSSLPDRVAALLTGSSMVSFSSLELLVTVPLELFLVGAVVARQVARRASPGGPAFGLAAAAALLLLLSFPDRTAGGAFLFDRVSLFFLLLLVVWLAARADSSRWRGTLQIVPAALSVAMLAVHAPSYARINAELEEYLTAAQNIYPGATLLPVSFAHRGCGTSSLRVRPLIHAAGYLAAQRPLVVLTHYQGMRSLCFPLQFRASVNPFDERSPWRKLLFEPPDFDIAAYEQRSGQMVHYVLLWCPTKHRRADLRSRAIFRQLDKFERVFRSPSGSVELFRRKG